MDIFSVLTLCGGLAFFLYGMTTMSKSLEKMAGGKLERLLKRMTSNPFKSLLLGAGITIAIQSSSAMTVMLVGLVNLGLALIPKSFEPFTVLTEWVNIGGVLIGPALIVGSAVLVVLAVGRGLFVRKEV